MKRSLRRFVVSAVIGAIAASGVTAMAHHSFAPFDLCGSGGRRMADASSVSENGSSVNFDPTNVGYRREPVVDRASRARG